MKLTDSTYMKLRDDIFNARYKPNTLITERQIAEKYGVSKLTAGEALHRLCAEGHLTSYPRSGYMVTILTPKEKQQLREIRYSLECLVINALCQEVSDDEIRSLKRNIAPAPDADTNVNEWNMKFHMGLAKASGNRFLVTMLQDILGSLSRVEQEIPEKETGGWQKYHEDILDALLLRDPDKAKLYLKKDIEQM